MDWKNFFKPTISKVGIFIIIIVAVSFIPRKVQTCIITISGVKCFEIFTEHFGYPAFYGAQDINSDVIEYEISIINLMINLGIYYLLISCLMVYIISKFKK